MIEVLVFVQQGCPACHEIRAMVDRIGAHYAACARTRFVDVTQESLLADTMMVRATPTVIATKHYRPVARMVGGDDAAKRLPQLYATVTENACVVPSWKGDL